MRIPSWLRSIGIVTLEHYCSTGRPNWQFAVLSMFRATVNRTQVFQTWTWVWSIHGVVGLVWVGS